MRDIFRQLIGGGILIAVGITIAILDEGFGPYYYLIGVILGSILTVWASKSD